MNFACIDDVRQDGFSGFVKISALQESGCSNVPDEPGVYLVLRPDAGPPKFLREGTGGRFKGTDPRAEIAWLQSKWVDGVIVLNIGKAGGPGITENLKGRLRKYMRFGQGKNSGHSGGRCSWQLRDSGDLLVCWKTTGSAAPRAVEKGLIAEFKLRYDKRPFANGMD
jgi:hypothetical protein